MKIVVITGSTRGIGHGLADAFLKRGCAVTVSGRTPAAVEGAVARLAGRHAADSILGHPCDVTRFAQVQGLWDAAQTHFGRVDVWINNAGLAHPQVNFWENPAERIQAVLQTNLIGAMYGAKVALTGMLAQGHGALYNMEGLGSDGRKQDGLTLYGTTKAGLRYLTDGLVKETQGTPVLVGALQPGMVLTDLVTDQFEGRPEDWERAKGIFNIIADRVETVAPWLAQKVLENSRHGARIKWLTRTKLIARFLSAPFRRRDLFTEPD